MITTRRPPTPTHSSHLADSRFNMGMLSWSNRSPDVPLDIGDMTFKSHKPEWEARGAHDSSNKASESATTSSPMSAQCQPESGTTPPRTVRKKKSSDHLRDDFQHGEFFVPPAPISTVAAQEGATRWPPLSHKPLSRTVDGQGNMIRRHSG